eukprot:365145-Chlamydomonas_euryale.AAC.7
MRPPFPPSSVAARSHSASEQSQTQSPSGGVVGDSEQPQSVGHGGGGGGGVCASCGSSVARAASGSLSAASLLPGAVSASASPAVAALAPPAAAAAGHAAPAAWEAAWRETHSPARASSLSSAATTSGGGGAAGVLSSEHAQLWLGQSPEAPPAPIGVAQRVAIGNGSAPGATGAAAAAIAAAGTSLAARGGINGALGSNGSPGPSVGGGGGGGGGSGTAAPSVALSGAGADADAGADSDASTPAPPDADAAAPALVTAPGGGGLVNRLVFGALLGCVGVAAVLVKQLFVFVAVFITYHATIEYYSMVTSKGITRGMAPPSTLVSSLTTVMCVSMVMFSTIYTGRSGIVLAVASFFLLVMNLVAAKRPTFSMLASTLFGVFYCGECADQLSG